MTRLRIVLAVCAAFYALFIARCLFVVDGAVYATLDRMEDKGLVSSWLSDPTPERGGRAKRFFRLEEAGRRALRESARTARRICDAVERCWGEKTWPRI